MIDKKNVQFRSESYELELCARCGGVPDFSSEAVEASRSEKEA